MLNRRDFLTRLAALGLVAATPASLRRYWQLDQTHLWHPDELVLWAHYHVEHPPLYTPWSKREIVGVNTRNHVVRFANPDDPTSPVVSIEPLEWFYDVVRWRRDDPVVALFGGGVA